MTLDFFDPELECYRTVATDTLRLVATPSRVPLAELSPGQPAREVELRQRDIRHIRAEPGRLTAWAHGFPGGAVGLGLQVLPLLAIGAVWGARRERQRREADPSERRFRGAAGEARKHLDAARPKLEGGDPVGGSAEVSRGIVVFLSERLQLRSHTLTPAEAHEVLLERGAPAELTDRVHRLLEECDAARFAPELVDADGGSRLLEDARALLGALQKVTFHKGNDHGEVSSP